MSDFKFNFISLNFIIFIYFRLFYSFHLKFLQLNINLLNNIFLFVLVFQQFTTITNIFHKILKYLNNLIINHYFLDF